MNEEVRMWLCWLNCAKYGRDEAGSQEVGDTSLCVTPLIFAGLLRLPFGTLLHHNNVFIGLSLSVNVTLDSFIIE